MKYQFLLSTWIHNYSYVLDIRVIPASKARRESFLKKDSGQAGMTTKSESVSHCLWYMHRIVNDVPVGVNFTSEIR
jgi:hypothetical protein